MNLLQNINICIKITQKCILTFCRNINFSFKFFLNRIKENSTEEKITNQNNLGSYERFNDISY